MAGNANIPVALVFTKKDKLSGTAFKKNLDRYKDTLLQNWEQLPVIFSASSIQNSGREEILSFIEDGNKTYFNGGVTLRES
jgi:GTP-binding protein